MKLFTIGCSGKSAESFFETLRSANIRTVLDVRLHNDSHLLSFARRLHLEYLLRAVLDVGYLHRPALAPREELMKAFVRDKTMPWREYEIAFHNQLNGLDWREIIDGPTLDNACLLCAEPKPDECHRRLVAEWLQEKVSSVSVGHL